MAFLLAIDQGTTSSRAIVFDTATGATTTAQQEFAQHFPDDGWVEHNPEDIWHTVYVTCREAMAKANVSAEDITAIGITNQRETTVVWDRKNGKAVYNAIVWQDRRTGDFCEELRTKNLETTIQENAGLIIDPYFSASKIRWILENVDGARQKAERGDLAFGTIDSFLLWRLTGGKVHRTDATNACRTSLFNIHKQQWDEELLKIFDIPAAVLPEICDNAFDFGVTEADLFGAEIPICAMVGDQQGALFGQACFESGMAKSTYGTGCFLILNTGAEALTSDNKLLTTVGYRLRGQVTYALEGSIFIAGAAVQWLRDGIHLIKHAKETEAIARRTPIDHGVILVPAFTGLGAPYWDAKARGAIFGLTRDTGIEEIVSATLQSVCYQTKDLQKAMESDGQRPTTLRVDGGMVANDWLLQFLADLLGADIQRPKIIETTALGAAHLAGLQAGVFSSLEELSQLWEEDRSFAPEWDKATRDGFYQKWQQAVKRITTK